MMYGFSCGGFLKGGNKAFILNKKPGKKLLQIWILNAVNVLQQLRIHFFNIIFTYRKIITGIHLFLLAFTDPLHIYL